MTLPNFLVVGAAKCGTTSLYHYLDQHSDIFMSPVKEPKFLTSQFLKFPVNGIGDDITEKFMVKDFQTYRKLFEKHQGEKAVGEASPDTMFYYQNSIDVIKKTIGTPKIIIILRNPVERAYSNYYYLVKDGRETLPFEKAIQEEENRMNNNWSYIWAYKAQGLYSEQVRAFLHNFDHVKILFYEDLQTNSIRFMKKLYDFLEVDSTFTPNIAEVHNKSGIPKNRILHHFLTRPSEVKKLGKALIKAVNLEQEFKSYSLNLKNKNLSKEEMRGDTRKILINYYKQDVMGLQDLLGLSLAHWLK